MIRFGHFFLLSLLSLSLCAQSNYDEAMQQANEAFLKENFTTAIKKYLIARAFDAGKREEVQKQLDRVYLEIEKQQQQLYLMIDTIKNVKTIIDDYKQKWESTKQELADTVSVLSTTRKSIELITKERDKCAEELELVNKEKQDNNIPK